MKTDTTVQGSYLVTTLIASRPDQGLGHELQAALGCSVPYELCQDEMVGNQPSIVGRLQAKGTAEVVGPDGRKIQHLGPVIWLADNIVQHRFTDYPLPLLSQTSLEAGLVAEYLRRILGGPKAEEAHLVLVASELMSHPVMPGDYDRNLVSGVALSCARFFADGAREANKGRVTVLTLPHGACLRTMEGEGIHWASVVRDIEAVLASPIVPGRDRYQTIAVR